MSHFTQMSTQLTNLDWLLKAAKKLGYDVVTSETTPVYANGFMGDKLEALAVIKTETPYDIGITKNDAGDLELTADWDLLQKVGEIDQAAFVNKIKQQYALASIEETAKSQNLDIGEPVVSDDGSIEVTVSQW